MSGKLWGTGAPDQNQDQNQDQTRLADHVARYTVGNDRQWDDELLAYDALASIGHVRGLLAIGILTDPEHEQLVACLRQAHEQAKAGRLRVGAAHEDCHTALEEFLIDQLGDLGRKVHTGRSRNDQVLVALRMWTKAQLLEVRARCANLVETYLVFAKEHERVLIPGYTHQRRAMPSTLGLWAAGFAESLLESAIGLESAFRLADRCPLGSAAGYGVPLSLERQLVSDELGFAELQHVVTTAQISRGKLETQVLQSLWAVGFDLSKASWDVILYASDEFGFLRLPATLATGSSIMPHKRNPDAFELTRGRAAQIEGWLVQAMSVSGKLPSGYQRDLQLVKEPLFRAMQTSVEMLDLMIEAVPRLEVDAERSRKAIGDDMLVTDRVFGLVRDGMPFRTAYRQVAREIATGDDCLDGLADAPGLSDSVLSSRRHAGAAGNLGLDVLAERLAHNREILDAQAAAWTATRQRLAGSRPRSNDR